MMVFRLRFLFLSLLRSLLYVLHFVGLESSCGLFVKERLLIFLSVDVVVQLKEIQIHENLSHVIGPVEEKLVELLRRKQLFHHWHSLSLRQDM